ncbi:MAG: hypothetical protein AAF446_08230, partial [Pseudomonadota bacterium]
MSRVALGVVGIFAVVLLGSFAAIHFLSDELDTMDRDLASLEAQNQRIRNENAALLVEQSTLTAQVDARAHELMALSDELAQIENMIGLEQAPMLPIAQRISTASHTAFERRWLLNSIPSGYP